MSADDDSFFANILTPGSSLHPTFLFILDCAFSFLLFIFITAAVLTKGNIHILALMAIELCLWASVKWYVNELKTLGEQEAQKKQDTEGEQGGKPEEEEETKETKKTI